MKKTFLLLSFFVILFTLNINAQTKDYSIINIYRPKTFCGAANGIKVYLNNIEICKLQNGGKLEYKVYSEGAVIVKVAPSFSVGTGYCSPITINVLRNNSYNFVTGFDCNGGMSLQQFTIPENQGINEDKFKKENAVLLTEDVDYPLNKITESITSKKTDWTEANLKTYWLKNGVDEIEGIYEDVSRIADGTKYKFGVIKNGKGYDIIYLSGSAGINANLWEEGQLKAVLTKTATSYLFSSLWYQKNSETTTDIYISFEKGIMNVIPSNSQIPKTIYLKLYPTSDDDVDISGSIPSSGSGFAISTDGYIATNYHVIDGANTIKIKGINSDFSKSYNAVVVVKDKNNDLAILQVIDTSFKKLSPVPYIINNTALDVGTSIFVLGYPLRATMGDEIKLTDGIISAKSGFKGDITSYQISAAAQSGNSGGPLFDNTGNLIGIVNAKYTVAENVTYAVKSSYLKNLIESLPTTPALQKTNILSGKSMVEQVKLIKSFVYIIEVN